LTGQDFGSGAGHPHIDRLMSIERTRLLSPEGSREVEEEMRRPPADTPERRAMFDLVRQWADVRRRRALLDALRDGT
jgi:hypothetical protein